MNAAIEMTDLRYAYRAKSSRGRRRKDDLHWALRGIDLRVDPGESIGVIGSNGSGKTTLLQCIGGVLQPTAGQLEVRGRVAALVHLFAGFHRELTGHENLMVAGVLNGMTRREVRSTTADIIEFSGLEPEVLDEPFRTYSAGMGLRLGFSVAVHTHPDVLLVDEVLAVGDEFFRQRCLQRVAEMRTRGCAVLVVSHDIEMIADQCERAAWLNDGALVEVDRANEVVERYRRELKPDPVGDLHPDPRALDRERRLRRMRRRL